MARLKEAEAARKAKLEKSSKKTLVSRLRTLADDLPTFVVHATAAPQDLKIPASTLSPEVLRKTALDFEAYLRDRDMPVQPEVDLESSARAKQCLVESVRGAADGVYDSIRALRKNQDPTQTEVLAFYVAQTLVVLQCALKALHSTCLALRSLADKRDFLVVTAMLDKSDADARAVREHLAKRQNYQQKREARRLERRMLGLPENPIRKSRGGSKKAKVNEDGRVGGVEA